MRISRISRNTPLIFLLLLLPAMSAMAHVEKGSMPDHVAEVEYRILLEFKPEDNATRSLLGMALLRQNKLPEAEKEFRTILKAEPKNFDALDSLGLILIKQKRYTEALQHLNTAIAARPNDIMVHLHLGLALGRNGQIEAATTTLATGMNLLNAQPSSPAREHQKAEFKTAMAALQKKPGATPQK